VQKQVRLPLLVLFIIHKLQEAGYEAYVVGGAVRDLLLEREVIRDWDVTTNATPDEIMPIFDESFYDNAFGTVMVGPEHLLAQMNGEWNSGAEIEEDEYETFDITTFRSEDGYTDNRRPDKVVWGTSLEEDVKRRDFTVNAIALKVKGLSEKLKADAAYDIDVELIDYYGGEKDLDDKVMRAVGDANLRFQEDALRMMRAIRIGAQLAFAIEPNTLTAIRDNASLITRISGERVRDELLKILASDYPADGVLLMHSSGLLHFVIPELEEAVEIPQGGHHIYDVWNHMIESLRTCPSRDPIVRLATLLHDVGKPRTMRRQGPRGVTFYGHEVVGSRMANQIADRLRLSKKEKEKLFILVRWHMFAYDTKMTDASIRRFIRRVGVENINDMMMLRIGDRQGGGSKATSWRLRELQQRIGENLYTPLSVKDLKINGNDVMRELEMEPGPVVGKILNQLFEEVMEDRLENEVEKLIERAKEMGK